MNLPARISHRPRWGLPRLPLRVWLIVSHLAVLVLPALVMLGSGALTADLRMQTHEDLEHQGALIAMLIRSEVLRARDTNPGAEIIHVGEGLNRVLSEAKASTLAGIRVVNRDGRVVATSGQILGEDVSDDPEVIDALNGEFGMVVRPRPGRNENHPVWSQSRRANVRIFVAVPVVVDQEVIGAIVLSRTPRDQAQALYHMAPRIGAAAVVASLGTAIVAIFSAWVATRSLGILGRGAERIAAGDFQGLVELARPRRSHLSEVAHTANAIATMTEQLQEKLAYITEFASNVSHEFKTPIATLRGTMELLSEDDAMPAEQRTRFFVNAAREVSRLERLVSGLLSLARAEESGAQAEVDLHDILNDVATVEEVPLVGRAGRVRGDRSQLESVVRNLIDNARHHGGEDVKVTVEAFHAPGMTGFNVVDNGKGITEANLARVFDRFFTTDRLGTGTGLGLALVHAIVTRHGGDVVVDSVPGRTAFSVRLPSVRGIRPA